MANEWNVSYPLDHTLISALPGEIRKLKTSAKTQIDREHETPVDGDATGGEHSLGAAVCYYGTATPTNRPDGATALGANNIDRGRLWIDSNFSPPVLKQWSGTAWVAVNHAQATQYVDDAAAQLAHTTVYKAETDGIVTAWGYTGVSGGQGNAFVGATSSPATAQGVSGGPGLMRWHMSFHVNKDYYWKVTLTGTSPTLTDITWSPTTAGTPKPTAQ